MKMNWTAKKNLERENLYVQHALEGKLYVSNVPQKHGISAKKGKTVE